MIPDTPYIKIDGAQLSRNIEGMAKLAASKNIALRPHVKTHKIIEIARLQMAAGASGITCATIAEAEEFARAGFHNIFIAYPLFLTPQKITRLNRLSPITIGVDSLEGAQAMTQLDPEITAFIEIDCGHRRSGILVDRPELRNIRAELGERYAGLFTFPGHSYGPGNGARAARQESEALRVGVDKLGGLKSGGSSPSAADAAGLDEMRPGVYVFNDAQQVASGACGEDDIAMTVATTVVSRNVADRRVILDAGSKILSTDKPAWIDGHGYIKGHSEIRIAALSEHHATVFWPAALEIPQIGEVLNVVPNHACNVINLVDQVYLNDAETSWNVIARGKNS